VSSPETQRASAIADILRATAALSATRAAFDARLAARMGLASSDIEVLRLLAAEGPATVGRIGEVTALTTGATTRMVDRLEQAGFVRRLADPVDRRRVNVELAPDRAAAVLGAYGPADEAARTALEALEDEKLGAIRSYLEVCIAAFELEPAGAAAAGTSGGSAGVSAPVASARTGRLVFVTGAPSVRIRAAGDLGTELYRARFEGAVPKARVRDGIVTIRYPRLAWFDWRMRVAGQRIDASAHWRRDRAELVLNASLPWSVELRGGATGLDADLRGLSLTSLMVAGGAGSLTVALGDPAGELSLNVSGGIRDLLVTRPVGTPTILSIEGGYRSATLDGEVVWSSGRIETPGAASAPDRLVVAVRGGADRVTIRGEARATSLEEGPARG
jgi:DNA-binding MarR family transcriptional regulator